MNIQFFMHIDWFLSIQIQYNMNTNHVELDLYVGNLDLIIWSSRIKSIFIIELNLNM
jgi:hypothetical protein